MAIAVAENAAAFRVSSHEQCSFRPQPWIGASPSCGTEASRIAYRLSSSSIERPSALVSVCEAIFSISSGVIFGPFMWQLGFSRLGPKCSTKWRMPPAQDHLIRVARRDLEEAAARNAGECLSSADMQGTMSELVPT